MDATDTAEPDEFAQLLAQLNGTPAPTPVVPVPTAPAPVAPAFGVAAPYPAAAPLPAAPVVAASLPRAPELMGADELAAPPRPLPPLSAPALELAPPPAYEAPAAFATPPPEFAAPAASELPPPAAAPPPAVAPAPAGPAPAAPPPAPAARAPLDFASLLATPVEADDVSGAAASPLNFAATQPDDHDDEPDLGRSTWGERIGLVLAVLIAPIGLIAGIAAAVRSARRRGWVVGIVRASIAIAAVLTVVLAIVGYFAYTQYKQQQAHDQTAAASAAFCAALKADPSMDQPPTFGWPAVAASIPDSLKAMQTYEDRWTKLAKVSPPGIKPGVARVAAAAQKIIDSVTVARTVDDAANVTAMSSAASSSGVPAWHSEYCG